MRNLAKRPIISPRKTAFLLIFSMLLSVFTVFPSFAEGSGGEVTPQLPDTASSDAVVTEPDVNIETETMQIETAVASAVTSTPVKVETANITISPQYGVDMSKDDVQNIQVFTTSSVQSVTASVDNIAVISCGTPQNIATGFYAISIQAIQVGIATITVNVTFTTGATETVSIEIYVVMEDGVYTIKNNASHLPTDRGDYYLNVQTPGAALPAVVASTHKNDVLNHDVYRYWKIEYVGNGEYYIRSLAIPEYSLCAISGGVYLSFNTTSYRRWEIRYKSGGYEIASCGTNNVGQGMVLSVFSVQIGSCDQSHSYYYGAPSVFELQNMAFERWSFEKYSLSGVAFREVISGTVDSSFIKQYVVNSGESFDLTDLGYVLVNLSGDPTATAAWRSSSPSIVTIDENSGEMKALSTGTTTITAALGGKYASITLTVVIAPLTEGIYFLRNLETGLYADIQGGTMSSGNEVEQQTFDGASTQKWKFEYYGGGNIYTIRSAQNSAYYLGVQNNSTANGANIVLRTGTVTNGMKWRILRGNKGWKICAFNNSNMVLATYSSDDEPGEKLILGDWVDNDSYRDEWSIQTGNVYIEFSYDMGFIDANRAAGESNSVVKARIQQNIANEFFPVVANAFAQKCGIYFMLSSSVANYTSDADSCPNSGIDNNCNCVSIQQCKLQYSDNPTSNNSVAGFNHNVHCKNFTRLRNNLIVNIPDNTIRITYSGHDLCDYDDVNGHSYTLAGLADYNYPIICINESQNSVKRSILVMAHEITHLYGIEHHAPIAGQPCIMEEGHFERNDYEDLDTYWCDNCINEIISNKDKY